MGRKKHMQKSARSKVFLRLTSRTKKEKIIKNGLFANEKVVMKRTLSLLRNLQDLRKHRQD